MVELDDLRTRDYAAMSYWDRVSATTVDFYSLLAFLIEHAGLDEETLGPDFRMWYRAGLPVDAFGEVADALLARDIAVPAWWFEQLSQIPMFHDPYDAEEVAEIAAHLRKVSGIAAPWEDSQTAA